jgi:hypothetical protein
MSQVEQEQEADTARRYQLIAMLGRAFNREVDEPLLLAYRMALQDLTLPQFEAAAGRALAECGSMPTPRDMRVIAGVDFRSETRASLAFDVLTRQVSLVGSYRSICFDDPILNATLNSLGGWVAVCETRESEWDSFFRQRFLKAYAANYEARRGTMHAQTGISDRTNAFNGLESVHPVAMIATDLPKIPGLTYERPKTINALIGDCAARIGLDKQDGPARIVGPDL